MIKDLFKRSGNYFVGLLFSRIFNLLLFIYLAKLLNPNDFGAIVFYTSILSLITLIGDFGGIQWYQKAFSLLRDKKSLLHDLLSARILALLTSIFVLSIYLFFTNTFSVLISLLLILSLIPESLLSIFDGYYLEKKMPAKISIKQISKSVILGIFIIVFSHTISLQIIAVALLISSFVNITWFVPWHYFKNFKLNMHRGLVCLKESSQYAVLIGTSYVYSRGDSLIIAESLGTGALGLYSAAYRYLEGISLLPSALAQNLFHLSAKKNTVSKWQLLKITVIMALLGIFVSTLLYISSKFLTTRLLGIEYSEASTVLQVLSVVVVFFFVNAPISTIVQGSDLLKQFIPWGIVNTTTNVILNIYFVPQFGIIAAAWIMLFTEASGMIINLKFVRKIYRNL